jgi:hypothetical protein
VRVFNAVIIDPLLTLALHLGREQGLVLELLDQLLVQGLEQGLAQPWWRLPLQLHEPAQFH